MPEEECDIRISRVFINPIYEEALHSEIQRAASESQYSEALNTLVIFKSLRSNLKSDIF